MASLKFDVFGGYVPLDVEFLFFLCSFILLVLPADSVRVRSYTSTPFH